jgi:hypothetical protein
MEAAWQGVSERARTKGAMMQQSRKEIYLGDDFGDVTIKVNGVRVEVSPYGCVLAYKDVPITVLCPVANTDSKEAAGPEPEIGDTMPDGTIYAGLSPDTGKAMFATPADAPLSYTFNEARKYAKVLDAHGHQDWRVPTVDELNVLFNNRAAIGGFNVTGSYFPGWYRSSSQNGRWYAWEQRFSAGSQLINHKNGHSSVRCVR